MLDIELLVAAISAKNKIGSDCRSGEYADLYRSIKDERMEARVCEKRFWEKEDVDKSGAHWRKVYQDSQTILQESGKDLEIAAWLCESSLRLHGFAGLNQSFSLIAKLVATYGAKIFPGLEDGDGLEYKVQALMTLNGDEVEGSLIGPIRNYPFTALNKYTLWNLEQAATLEFADSIQEKKMRDEGIISKQEIIAEVNSIEASHYSKLLDDLDAAINSFALMTKSLDEVFLHDAPPCSRIADALSDYKNKLSYLLRETKHKSLIEVEEEIIKVDEKIVVNSATQAIITQNVATVATVRDRDSALAEILKVADYFTQTEPQSIVPYMLRRVVDWAKLPAPELLAKIINNSAELNQVYALTGTTPLRSDK
jgi:type VI secretion system protein ImpA